MKAESPGFVSACILMDKLLVHGNHKSNYFREKKKKERKAVKIESCCRKNYTKIVGREINRKEMKNENILFECSPLPKPSSPHLKHHLKVACPDSSVVVSALLSMTM